MSKNFDEFKNKTFDALRETISGDSGIVINIINVLLDAQAKDLENTFTNEQIKLLNARIDELERLNRQLAQSISRYEK
ncbi:MULTISPECIES: hypothetical protein [Streptococcus]|jgi:hypothetical protein|nr:MULTISPECIES: hypothetical protein [Streptococcus]MCW1057153.1 hypothetical protein [Streptococcus anginosus]MED5861319.1 hypothetical protein [Streptococcus anginosus]MED5961351.1 hypothetical protein [Streptococcus anginosus]NGG23873.1 hypothetical protein [Streptococcus anginosus]